MTGYSVLVLLLLSTGCCWAVKLCCEPTCSEVISYGTTITRHISKQQDYLSFPRNALVEVYAKIDDPDVWLVKYGNKKGFVPQKMILEKTVNCENLISINEEETTKEDATHDQVNDDSPGDHGNQEHDTIIVGADAPEETGNDKQYIDDMRREDRTSESVTTVTEPPTGVADEEINKMPENTLHDVLHSPTLPPQVDSYDSEKLAEPVEPAKQDDIHYKPELDDDREEVFEFDTEEQLNKWSDHMMNEKPHMSSDRDHMSSDRDHMSSDQEHIGSDKVHTSNDGDHMSSDRDHMSNEEAINKDKQNDNNHLEESRDEVENDESENEDFDEEDVDEEEQEDGDEEEREEEDEDKWKAEEAYSEQHDDEEEDKLPHMTSHDHEQHHDVDSTIENSEQFHGEDDPKVFEKIAEELAAATKPPEWEELVEKQLDGSEQDDNLVSSTSPTTVLADNLKLNPSTTYEHVPITVVTDSLEVNPSTTYDQVSTVTSVVMATVDSGEMSTDESKEDDGMVEVNELPDDGGKDDETSKQQLEHAKTDEHQETSHSANNNDKVQEKHEQPYFDEISEIQQKYEQEQYKDGEAPQIHDKEDVKEHPDSSEDVRSDEIQKSDSEELAEGEETHGTEDKETPQQLDDDKQRVEELLQREEGVVEDLERPRFDEIQAKDEAEDLQKNEGDTKDDEGIKDTTHEQEEEKDELKYEEDKEGVKEAVHEQEKPFHGIQPSQEVQQQPSLPDHPHSVTIVEEESMTTSVDMTTHDIHIPHATPSPVVVTTSVTMTTDNIHDSKVDTDMVLEEKTVEVVHKPDTGYRDNNLRDIKSRQSEDMIASATRELERPRLDEIQVKNEAENLQKNEGDTKDDEGIKDTIHEQEDEKEERMKKKRHHGTRQTIIVSLLPSFLADMVDMDDNSVYTLLGTIVAILLPCGMMSCRSSIKSNRQRKELESMQAKCRSADDKVTKLEEEKNQLLIKYNTELGKSRSVEELLSAEKQNVALLQQANNEVNQLLVSTQTQLQQYQAHNDQLVGELTTERQLHATQIATTQEAQQEIMTTRTHLQQVSQQVTELEATREQLEQELFTAKQNIDELQATHLKLQQSHDEVTQRCGSLDEQLVSVRSNLDTAESLVKEKDDELKLLRECLLQLQSDESDGEVDKETESNSQRKVLSTKDSKIEKVHAMLDTTKVQTELKSVKEERRSLQQELETKNHILQQLEDELEQTKTELARLRSEQDELSLQHAETEIKLKTLTEYFEHKEQNLHRKLGVEEAARQEIENREATAMEKVSLAEEERVKERAELHQLRQQMSEIEKSLMQQVITNDKRAQEALAQLRRTEQELRVANREVNDLKKRLSGSRPTSPGGSETSRPPSQPPMPRQRYSPPLERYHEPVPIRRRPPSTGPRMETRPLSAPRFPRTSSPSELDHTHPPPMAGRQLNDTYPGPSRPIPQPHPPRDSHSLDDRDRLILRGPDEGKGIPPPSLHHHPRLPPQKSLDRMDRPMPMSDRPPLAPSLSDHHHSLPPRHMLPPPGPRADHNMMMPGRRPPLYHQQPHPGPTRPPPSHDPLSRRPGPPSTHNRQQTFDTTEPAKHSDQHKMEV